MKPSFASKQTINYQVQNFKGIIIIWPSQMNLRRFIIGPSQMNFIT